MNPIGPGHERGVSDPQRSGEQMGDALEVQYVTIHGHRRAFVKTGSGPAVLLLHGMGCDHTTWEPVIERLARQHTVIAPDLLGHGRSDKPRADYSVGGYANGMRDLLTVLGIDKATVVGHSLGGGVAMQFGYQFPERTERLVLVAPGGLGREVTPIIRAVTLPGFHAVVGALTLPGVRHLVTGALRRAARADAPALRDLDEIAAIVEHLEDPRARRALKHVVSACVDLRGQIISMTDRAYLTREMPMCVIWGSDDQVIPTKHADNVRRIADTAEVKIVGNAGHFPHKDHPDEFVRTVERFIRTHEPAVYHRGRWRALLKNGAPAGAVIPDSRVVTIA
jgi:pimeloyl-ACP methyl ester carboxylesterase